MSLSTARARRFGHRETPFIALAVWLFCTLGMGWATAQREAVRAAKVGATLQMSQKWTAFWHGCLIGTAIFVGLLLALFIAGLLFYCYEQWRWKRGDAIRKQIP